MSRRPGLQLELLVDLALVMALALLVVLGVSVFHLESTLQMAVGRALLAEARSGHPLGAELYPGTRWWTFRGRAEPTPQTGTDGEPAAESRALAADVQEQGAALVRLGPPWAPIRFGAQLADGSVVVAELPESESRNLRGRPLATAALLAGATLVVFTSVGAFLLRRNVVAPLERLAAGARAIAEGQAGIRVAVEGPPETEQVARAFNEMTEALEGRSEALRKAVVDLRTANSELWEARAGLDRAERLAAVGRLAAGVAHEVGNPIGAILAFMDLAARDAGLSETGRSHLSRAAREGERVRRILRQLLDFSRPARPERRALDLPAIARDACALLQAQARYQRVRFEFDATEALAAAAGDAGAVSQILLNLLLNAADAALGAEQPRVCVCLRPGALRGRSTDGAGAPSSRGRPDAVACSVLDNGPGISPEDRERIFDPFFTTKAPGEGTGLGLSTALRLAEEMGGTLALVNASAEMATAFELLLPCSPAPSDSVRQG